MLTSSSSVTDIYDAIKKAVPDWPDPHIDAEIIRHLVLGDSDDTKLITRVAAVNAAVVNERWSYDWLPFIYLCLGLNGVEFDPGVLEQPMLAHVGKAVCDIKSLYKHINKLVPDFSEDVVAIIQTVARIEGCIRYPTALREYEPEHSIEDKAQISAIDKAIELASDRHDIDWDVFPDDIVSHNTALVLDINKYCDGE